MNREVMSGDVLQHRMRSERQRTRTGKENKYRDLRHQWERLKERQREQRALPMIPLAEPYQRGWKRHFVVTDKVLDSENGVFYQQLLKKLNSTQHWHDATFRRHKHRSKSFYEHPLPVLRTFSEFEWHRTCGLSDMERTCFHKELRMSKTNYWWVYVFCEPWRYVITVEPHIIYQVRMVDTSLESEISEIKNHFDRRHLTAIVLRQLKGNGQYKWHQGEREKEKYSFKNKAFHTILDECYYQQ